MACEKSEKAKLAEQKSEPALNYDVGKERLELVPPAAIYAIARAFEDGQKKGYPANNWLKGMSYSRQIGCILRHLFVWVLGRQKDPESGLHPLDHCICRLAMLVTYEANPNIYAKYDDRYKFADKQKDYTEYCTKCAEKIGNVKVGEAISLCKKCAKIILRKVGD